MGRGNHVKDDALVAAVRELEPPVVSTAEVLEAVELADQGHLLRRLSALRDEGRIGGREVGRQWVWWALGDVADGGK